MAKVKLIFLPKDFVEPKGDIEDGDYVPPSITDAEIKMLVLDEKTNTWLPVLQTMFTHQIFRNRFDHPEKPDEVSFEIEGRVIFDKETMLA